ncbi:hypothetical protein [Larkinella punicea]|uniref:Transposase n=1 Tax=Larkinella punicea TaxID=2315727 RepID=A0A368JNM9_9BACT|nr:hypothetical protein [Larkinella punicea]RCR68626.1 hypothetical protein DUE52_16080 [Larkinella punicea]
MYRLRQYAYSAQQKTQIALLYQQIGQLKFEKSDGRCSRAIDNVLTERFWRTLKYEPGRRGGGIPEKL